MRKLILASNSPRRKNILKENGYSFIIDTSDFKEINNLSPVDTVIYNAKGKAETVYKKYKNTDSVILSADTIVVFNDKIIGKPKDEKDAFDTLKMLSNNTHKVITGYAIIYDNKLITGYDESTVTFDKMTDEYLLDYVKSGKPMDKAGSYGLQDNVVLVKNFGGNYDNIIGLPLTKIKPVLDKIL